MDETQPSATENAVHGTVIGPSVQAGTIHGGVHIHTAASSSHQPPHQLAPSPAVFVGRASELEDLDRLRRSGHPLVVLTGHGGSGKTFLARQWAHRIRRDYPDGQLYIDLNGFSESDPVDPGEALSHFLRALGADVATLPPGLATLVALYRSRTADRAILIVLDNALSDAQVRVLLPASATSLVVVTSRRQLTGLIPDGAVAVEVGPMSPAESIELMSRTIGAARVAAEPAPAEELARLCDGLPLALSVVTARLARRPRLRIMKAAEDLREQRDSRHGPRGTESVFDLSYRTLEPSIRALYRRLSVNPGPEFAPGPIAALLRSSTPAEDEDDVEAAIDLLLELRLLEEVSEGRFRLHDLLFRYARQRLSDEETLEQRDLATRTVLEWYLTAAQSADLVVTPYRRRLPYAAVTSALAAPAFDDRNAALDWLETERANLIAAGRLALDRGWPELAWQFADVLWPLLLYRKHYRDRRGIDETGVEAARRWGNGLAEAEMLVRLGRACTQTGDHDDAEQHLRNAVLRFGEADHRRGVTDAQEMLAALYRDSGRHAEALVLFDAVLIASRDLGDDRSTGKVLINLGSELLGDGRVHEAVRLLWEAQAIFAQLTVTDPYNGFRADRALAAALLAAGDIREAEAAAERGASGMRQLGSRYKEAQALEILAEAARLRGDHELAERHFANALQIYHSFGAARAAVLQKKSAVHET